jgi:hypothetical protein
MVHDKLLQHTLGETILEMPLLLVDYLSLILLSLETSSSVNNGRISFMPQKQVAENQTGFNTAIEIGYYPKCRREQYYPKVSYI